MTKDKTICFAENKSSQSKIPLKLFLMTYLSMVRAYYSNCLNDC